MDALSELLRVVHLHSAVFFAARLAAPWSFFSPPAASVKDVLAPRAEKLVLFHLFTEGECVLELEGLPPRQLQGGDIAVFPHGDAHRLASAAHVPAGPPLDLPALMRRGPRELTFGGAGRVTRCLCGFLLCDPRLCRPVLTGLPRVLTATLRDTGGLDWAEHALDHAVHAVAAQQPGGEGMLAKLSELLFVETLRRHIAALPPEQTGWLAGVRDPLVGRALALLHARAGDPWTVDALAREAGASRSVLAERFTHFVGQAPMQYLAQWRMALAAHLLRNSAASLARVAEEVGYETDAAFSRAFRREYGLPPASWRRAQRGEGDARVPAAAPSPPARAPRAAALSRAPGWPRAA